MKITLSLIIALLLLPLPSSAGKNNPTWVIAREPVTMMDLGILRLNASLNGQQHRSLRGATFGARYNARKGTIDIKISQPVNKASKTQCKNIINKIKKIFVRKNGKKKVSTIHHYFQHEGTGYTRKIKWDDVAKHVVIIGNALTRKNFRDSVFCQSYLMKDKVTY